MRFLLFTLHCSLLTVLVGCGGKDFSVGGKVTFTDGTPVPRGQVTFTSTTFSAGSSIAADGSYTLNVKAPAGTYGVSVRASGESSVDPNAKDIRDIKPAKSLVDTKFNSPETSGLTCEVKGTTKFDITVEPPGK